ncbi:hypothetical protein [Desertihabitans aurantiacus]|nr:hypothetical protein [Desertihabitans aurantiacus]
MYEMYPHTWGEGRLEETGQDARLRELPTPRRRPRREHSVAPRVQTTSR